MAEIPTRFSGQSAQRISHWIGRKPASNLWHAFNFAAEISRPLTLFVTLNFSLTDCPPELATAKFRLIVETFTRWWRRPSRRDRLGQPGAFAYVWVAENGGGQAGIHWVLHMPAGRRADFAARLAQWMATNAGSVQPGAIDVRDAYSPPGLRRYLLKGCDPNYAAFCKIDFEAQGVVHGKRSGVSRSLQRAARDSAGYRINRTYRSRVMRPEASAGAQAAP
jgi:hypothetical protein